MSREQSKAIQYIQQLDQARCQGSWDELPELVRKVRKHAPARTCLTLSAEAEHAVTQFIHARPTTGRPSTARPTTATSTKSIGISKYIPLLLEAIEKEGTYVEDKFQAQVCLGWIHWQIGEPALAAARLPKSIAGDFSQLNGINKGSAEWTKICALKGCYIKGCAQSRTGQTTQALATFESVLPILSTTASFQKQGKELQSWTELYLTAFCTISSLAIKTKVTSVLESETLTAFRAWAIFWDNQGPAPVGGHEPQAEVSRRYVWREYYITLSDLLQQGLPFPPSALAPLHAQTSTQLQQREELKRVEARYEALLLSEVQFPRAEERSEEVESFVEVAIQNWRVLCGTSWQEEDLGEGGSEAISRGVLDILYRAATKTFHSTAVLRHLFTLHLAVADFHLAFKAFDTYLEIVQKGKARVEKTGVAEAGLDDDDTVLMTASECIKALCRYGSLSGAEKAKDLGQFFENWLDKHHPAEKAPHAGLENETSDIHGTIAPRTIALTWRCIGIGHAQWARLTFDATARAEIQLRAIKCFQNALLPQYESTTNVDTLFALGTILAERRELSAAIDVVKTGLLPQTSSAIISDGLRSRAGGYLRERSLIPLWHLMALLLSARQEFMTAARSCEGAFEQFQDPKNLFGDADLSDFRSEHLTSNKKTSTRNRGVVDDMDDYEKSNVLEVKITQLALVEVLEGPEIAVNASDELLSLYSRLFGDPESDRVTAIAAPSISSTTVPPRSSAGTMKSMKGSLFGRSSRSRFTKTSPSSLGIKSTVTLRPQTAQTTATNQAPTIQVTSENGGSGKRNHHLLKEDSHYEHGKLQKRTGSLVSKKGSMRNQSPKVGRQDTSGETNHTATTVDGETFFTPPVDTQHREQWLNDGRAANSEAGQALSLDYASDASTNIVSSQQMAHREPSLKVASLDPVHTQESRMPHLSQHSSFTNPITKFPQEQRKRRRVAILIKVWLLISGFYRRAALYDDAKGAIEEAYKLVENMDEEVSHENDGDVSRSYLGWGGCKSVAELWGDVYAERGALAVAESAPYAALAQFEFALNNWADHPEAVVGLSNILLDIYTEDLLPTPSIPLLIPSGQVSNPSASTLNTSAPIISQTSAATLSQTPGPLGLPSAHAAPIARSLDSLGSDTLTPTSTNSNFAPSINKEASTTLLDRLAARDRAYGLLSGLTKLGTGWNYSEAWFALARAYELGGQADKAREVLWWCVELEEGRAVRGWEEAGGGYVL